MWIAKRGKETVEKYEELNNFEKITQVRSSEKPDGTEVKAVDAAEKRKKRKQLENSVKFSKSEPCWFPRTTPEPWTSPRTTPNLQRTCPKSPKDVNTGKCQMGEKFLKKATLMAFWFSHFPLAIFIFQQKRPLSISIITTKFEILKFAVLKIFSF